MITAVVLISLLSSCSCSDKFHSGKASGTLAPRDVGLYFNEFLELYESQPEFTRWFEPLRHDIDAFLKTAMKNSPSVRVQLLQGAFLDLVEFLDPPPRCAIIPSYRRRRISMSPCAYDTPMPKTLKYGASQA